MVNAGAKLRLNGEVWSVVICLFADDTVLSESEGNLQRVVNEFYSVCKKRKLKVYNFCCDSGLGAVAAPGNFH